MRKKIIIISVLLLVLLEIGCSSSPKIIDKSVPMEKSCTLNITSCYVEGLGGDNELGSKTVIIPAGTRTLNVIAIRKIDGNSFKFTGSITFEFQPMRKYVVGLLQRTSQVIILDEEKLRRNLIPDNSNPNATKIEGVWAQEKGKKKSSILFANNEFLYTEIDGVFYTDKVPLIVKGTFNINGNQIILNESAYTTGLGEDRKWYAGNVWTKPKTFNFNGSVLIDTSSAITDRGREFIKEE